MNHVYRVVFNHALKCVQVVSEIARGPRAASSSAARPAPQLAALSTAIALGCMAPAAFAGINGYNEWRGGTGTDWSAPGSWELGEPNGSGVAAYIDAGRAVVTAPNESTNHIHLGYTGRGDLSILGGGHLTSATIFVGTGDRPGTATTAEGRALISGAGSTWTSMTTIGVGHLGFGRVDVENGGVLTMGTDSYVGAGTTGMGVIAVNGQNSLFNTDGNLYLGNEGNGDVLISGQGRMTSVQSFVGNTLTGVGMAEIAGAGSSWLNYGDLTIGRLGKGTVMVLDGATAEVRGGLFIGNLATNASNRSRGDLVVTGNNSRFTHTAGVSYIGSSGVGVIEVSDGGAISLQTVSFGQTSSGVGTALITGSGSTWESNTLLLGTIGYGSFDVRDGATATVRGNINLADSNLGAGYVLVGQDATLDMAGAGPATITTGATGMGWMELNGGTLRASTALRVDSEVKMVGDSVLDADQAVLVRGTISGSGRLTKTGTGSLALSNADRTGWTGGLQVEAGTLTVAGSAALGWGWLGLDQGTTLSLFDGVTLYNSVQMLGEVAVAVGDGESATLSGSLSGDSSTTLVKRDAGTLTLGGGTVGETRVEAGTLRVTGNALNGGNIDIAGGAAFEIDTTRVLSYAGQISGSGFLRQGRHSLTLSGDSSAFTGTTVINGGQLNVTGSLGGDVQVTRGGWLTGNGSLGNVFVSGGSTLSPGNNIGSAISRMDIAGVLNFDDSSTFQVDVAANGVSDFVSVGGSALLGQANTVAVAADGDWKASTRYHLLTAAGGVNGTFAGASSNLAFLNPTLEYDPNNVYLVMARNDVSMPDVQLAFPDVVLNRNQQEVAGAVEALGEGNAVYDAVVRLAVPQVAPAFDSLSGEVHAAHRGTLLQNRFLHDGIDRHLDGRAINGELAPGVNVWVAGSGGQLRTDATANSTATRVSQDGLMAGAGWQLGESLEIGVAAGQQRLETRLQDRVALAKSDATEYGLYARYEWQGLQLRGGVTRADYRTDTTRTAQVGTTLSEDLVAREDATGTTAFVRAGWTFGGPRLQLTPEIELAHVRLESDGSQERGGHSALRTGAADSDYRTGLAALKADWDISGGQRDLAVLTARVGWQYADGDRLPVANARFVAGERDFVLAGAPIARSSALAQLGVAISPSANSRVSLQMQGRHGDGQREVGAQLDWSVAF